MRDYKQCLSCGLPVSSAMDSTEMTLIAYRGKCVSCHAWASARRWYVWATVFLTLVIVSAFCLYI
jgi:hypothetical protein